MNGVTVWEGRAGRNGPARSPLSGAVFGLVHPGLKPWQPRAKAGAKALGYSVRPFHGQKPAAAHQPPITDQ